MATTTKSKANTSRVKTKNTPSLKSQGAGYSTTNSKGVTTYYKSAKDAPGYSDTKDGKNVPTSAGKPISQVDATGKVINSTTLGASPIILPPAPKIDPLKGVADMNNASLGGANYDATTKQFTTPPAGDNSFDTLKSYLGANAQAFSDIPTQESLLKEQRKMLKPKEDLANSLQGQLNTLTANRDAEILKLEGQGRGQTQGFIGGEQARINREATIQAMPIQAQLAIAQDDLESARSYASQLFQAKSQDALARYNYQKELNSTIFNYLNESEKRRLAQVEREQDRAFQVEQTNRATLKQIGLQAIEYGQGALAGEIMRLDPKSATFEQDYADAVSRLRKPVATGSGGLSAGQEQRLNGVINNYTKDTIIQNGQNVVQLRNIAEMIKKDPNNASNQLISLYTLIKSLDPESVVREGEVALASQANSYLGRFGDSFARISEGRVINPKVTTDLADATIRLTDEWLKTAQRRESQYKAQAGVIGVGDPFDKYISSFDGVSKIPSSGQQNNDTPEQQIFNSVVQPQQPGNLLDALTQPVRSVWNFLTGK